MTTHWWAGGYTADMDGTAAGISLLRARADRTLEFIEVAVDTDSPSYLVARGDYVYASAEGAGRVGAFHRSGLTLAAQSQTTTGGVWPCQLTLLDDAIVAANYGDGSLAVVALDESGATASLAQLLPSEGSGPHAAQDGPHAHASLLVDATTLVSADLGADRLLLHSVDGHTLTRTGSVSLPPGTGPRDFAVHPSGTIWVLGELGGSMHVFDWTGSELVPVASIVLAGFVVGDHAAAIGFSADGTQAYAGLRGSNRVSVVSTDGRALSAAGFVDCGGDWPRHLTVDGDVLHVANQKSSSVASFRLVDGALPALIGSSAVPSPIYLLAAD